jgi:pSer/pThr/pTyr-binding forkhead associated (FHA) protein
MGAIREIASGRTQLLEWEHLIGRAEPPRCALTLSRPEISAVHAMLRWTGKLWELKDLGSTNGTYVDGHVVERGGVRALRSGAKISFGRQDDIWQLVDASMPTIMAVPLPAGEPRLLEDGLIGLPTHQEPLETIYCTTDGGWVLERADQTKEALSGGDTFESLGRLWRFCCPRAVIATVSTQGPETETLDAGRLKLTLAVSRNEEYVQATIGCGASTLDLGSSVYNFLLLTLARQRLADVAQGLPETSCGWMDLDEFEHDPMMGTPQVNLAVYRVRQQFARAGVENAAMIIERRPRALRIGTPHLAVVPL